jgi:hypothetical protein
MGCNPHRGQLARVVNPSMLMVEVVLVFWPSESTTERISRVA